MDTGSGMKDCKLKSKDFFDAQNDPLITFHSTKITQTGPDTFDIDGDITIRGVTKPEKLTLTDITTFVRPSCISCHSTGVLLLQELRPAPFDGSAGRCLERMADWKIAKSRSADNPSESELVHRPAQH